MTRITNRGSRDYKTGQLLGIKNRGRRDCKWRHVQKLQNGASRLQIEAGIIKRGKRLQIRAKGLQIGAWITKPGKKNTNRGRDYKFGKNLNDLWFQVWHEEFDLFIHPTFHKSRNFTLIVSFCPKYIRFIWKGVIFHDTELWCKTWINPDFAVSKMAWGIGWIFIRALKSLKNCILMGSFCPKYIMFQLESFRGIMCHATEGQCKI